MKPLRAANDNLKDDLVRRTREVWQPRFGCDLSREDARQIAVNVTGFFSVLAEWSRAEQTVPVNDNDEALTADSRMVVETAPSCDRGAPDHG